MRPLTDEETQVFLEKLSKYIGDNIELLIKRSDGNYCFRLHRERVFYASEFLVKKAAHFPRDKLISIGTCFGKFTASKKFKLKITALEYLAPYAKHKVWLKAGFESKFLSGQHIIKSGMNHITEATPRYQGVIVYTMNDVPLGFGVSAKAAVDCRKCDIVDVVVFHQADNGEYIRDEDTLL